MIEVRPASCFFSCILVPGFLSLPALTYYSFLTADPFSSFVFSGPCHFPASWLLLPSSLPRPGDYSSLFLPLLSPVCISFPLFPPFTLSLGLPCALCDAIKNVLPFWLGISGALDSPGKVFYPQTTQQQTTAIFLLLLLLLSTHHLSRPTVCCSSQHPLSYQPHPGSPLVYFPLIILLLFLLLCPLLLHSLFILHFVLTTPPIHPTFLVPYIYIRLLHPSSSIFSTACFLFYCPAYSPPSLRLVLYFSCLSFSSPALKNSQPLPWKRPSFSRGITKGSFRVNEAAFMILKPACNDSK